jgi:hypothetical protein
LMRLAKLETLIAMLPTMVVMTERPTLDSELSRRGRDGSGEPLAFGPEFEGEWVVAARGGGGESEGKS